MALFLRALASTVPLLLGIVLVVGVTGCATDRPKPTNWTLWYIPNEPQPGVTLAKPCRTYVFASSPGQAKYVVAVVKGWTGTSRPAGNTASMHSGEDFTGPLELGSATVHDDSNGYDLNVDVVYSVESYIPAKVRADADCGPPPAPVSAPRPRPRPTHS